MHAIAGKAGMSCKPGDRHDDGHGVDAEINFRGATAHNYISHVQLNIQLKATITSPGSHRTTYLTILMVLADMIN